MKTIGLIGGMSWKSTANYYKIINETVKNTLGGLHSAKLVLYSVDFAEIEERQSHGAWHECAEIMTAAAMNLERAGAECIVICTNTMHKIVPEIQNHIRIPILHIADVTADALIEADIRKAALLGTKYTMMQNFFKEKLLAKGISVVIPDEDDIKFINDVIFDELCLGITSDSSRKHYQEIIEKMKANGAEGVILGCTEIGLLIQQQDVSLPVFDTTLIHAQAAAKKSMD